MNESFEFAAVNPPSTSQQQNSAEVTSNIANPLTKKSTLLEANTQPAQDEEDSKFEQSSLVRTTVEQSLRSEQPTKFQTNGSLVSASALPNSASPPQSTPAIQTILVSGANEYPRDLPTTSAISPEGVASNTTNDTQPSKPIQQVRSRSDETSQSGGQNPSVDLSTTSGLDDYIRSPGGQNAIVERSPGGRYVRFMEKLGSGASKDVYRAYDTQEGIEVAWNVVNLSGVPKSERNRIVNEVRLLERLHHQNIISFHGSWVNRERQEVNFVTEILSSGTLKSFINKVQVIRWKIAKRWAVQILNGLEYLHSQDPPVIHRDLKCENIFINGTSGDLRIGDLGLSTVHRNGKVLSVLGTPEFMAPDMYEETSYDEKVDVYAFGMCMLEIFTKEIPYSECKNPAQIYKKVSNGEPPEVLSRLQSKHARDFVVLCLGTKGENGKYNRPSVTELLQHSFLEKRPNDDDEVVVLPPLRELSLSEAESETDSARSGSRLLKPTPSFIPSRSINPKERNIIQSQNSSDDTDGDTFGDMQESEILMRKVKVLMGRGQELEDDDEPVQVKPAESVSLPESDGNPTVKLSSQPHTQQLEQQHVEQLSIPQVPQLTLQNQLTTTTGTLLQQSSQSNSGAFHQHTHSLSLLSQQPVQQSLLQGNMLLQQQPPSTQVVQSTITSQHQVQRDVQSVSTHPPQLSSRHYFVAAAVMEYENPNIRPYADEILKLVVSLPVEGQTRNVNVQFDFHLVEDDPVQVAKEMVQELGIPQAAVLEISETISSLARAARMKQEVYAVGIQQNSSQNQTNFPTAVVNQNLHPNQHVVSTVNVSSSTPVESIPYQAHGVLSSHSHTQQHFPPHGAMVNGGTRDLAPFQHATSMHSQLQNVQQHQPNTVAPLITSQQEQFIQNNVQFQRHNIPDQSVGMMQDFAVFNKDISNPSHQLSKQQHGHQGNQVVPDLVPFQHSTPQSAQQQPIQSQLLIQTTTEQVYVQQGQSRIGNLQGITGSTHDQSMLHPLAHVQQPVLHGISNNIRLPGRSSQESVPYHFQPTNTNAQPSQPIHVSQPSMMQQPNDFTQTVQVHQPGVFDHSDLVSTKSLPGEHVFMHQVGIPAPVPSADVTAKHHPGMNSAGQEHFYAHPNTSYGQIISPVETPSINQQIQSQPAFQDQLYSQSSNTAYIQTAIAADSVSNFKHLNISQQQQQFTSHQAPTTFSEAKVSSTSFITQSSTKTMSSSTPISNVPISSQLLEQNSTIQSNTQNYAAQPMQFVQQNEPVGSTVHPQAHHLVEPVSLQASQQIENSRDITNQSKLDLISSTELTSVLPKPVVEDIGQGNSPSMNRHHDNVESIASLTNDIDSDEDEDLNEEMRKLEEEFQRNLQRAQKVFVNRMDNLQRSQVEREAQHQKTLERHLKERADYEKRLAQEEEQQNRRIEQLQREWDKKRETVALNKKKSLKVKNGLLTSDMHIGQSNDPTQETTSSNSFSSETPPS